MQKFLFFFTERDTGQRLSLPPTAAAITQVSLLLLTLWLTDCRSSGFPLAEGASDAAHPGRREMSWAGGVGRGLEDLARVASTRKAGRPSCPGAHLGQVNWGVTGLLFTHVPMSVSGTSMEVKSQSSQMIGFCSGFAKNHKPTFPKGK